MMYSSTSRLMIHPADYDLFVGMDVDKRSTAITTRYHLELGRSLMMSNDADLLSSYIRNHHSGKRIAFVYEAGPTGFGLYDAIVAGGHTCLVVAPQAVPTPRGKRVRTNRLDDDAIKATVEMAVMTADTGFGFAERVSQRMSDIHPIDAAVEAATKVNGFRFTGATEF